MEELMSEQIYKQESETGKDANYLDMKGENQIDRRR